MTHAINIATYNIQIFALEEDLPQVSVKVNDVPVIGQTMYRQSEDDKRVLSNLPAMLEAVEEDLTSLLPPGYEARIREWSSDE